LCESARHSPWASRVARDKRYQLLPPAGYFDLAWETLLQRLERTSTKERASFMIIHDEGENDAIRRWVRQSRRHLTAGHAFGGGGSAHPARRLVDDPVARRSEQSYLVQLADLVAYAAFRSVVVPGPSLAAVCPQTMWAEIGPATHTAVSRVKPRAAPGIVLAMKGPRLSPGGRGVPSRAKWARVSTRCDSSEP